MRSDQRSLGFRVDQCHVQLSGVKSPIMAFAGVYIYIKTTSNLLRAGKEKLKSKKSYLRFYIKTITAIFMIIGSEGIEIKLLIG